MASTASDLVARVAEFVTAPPTNAYVIKCTEEAHALVSRHVGTSPVPAEVQDRAVIEVAGELFWRKQARGGALQFDGGADAGVELVRLANDPLRTARPLLAPFLGGGIA